MEAMDTMVEAMKPAATKPISPAGNNRRINIGYTVSALGKWGNNKRAQVPGNTIKNKMGSFSNPANRAPHRAWSMFLADSTLCTID
jgi:hypothetical protein